MFKPLENHKMWKSALYFVALLLVIAALNLHYLLSVQAFGDPTCPSTRWEMLMVHMACGCVHTYCAPVSVHVHICNRSPLTSHVALTIISNSAFAMPGCSMYVCTYGVYV